MILSSRLVSPIVAGLILAAFPNAQAAVSYSSAGSTYSENFDSLPTDAANNGNLQTGGTPTLYPQGWTDDTTTVASTRISVPGWYLYYPITTAAEGGANSHQRFRIGNGANTGSFWGFGSTSAATDKSLGSLGSTTTAANGENFYTALRLVNDTGSALTDFNLTYDGEQWRDGQSAAAETLSFAYSLSATIADWNTTAIYNNISSLNFSSPVFAGTVTAGSTVDGNTAGRIADITGSANGLVWAPGAELWLRWADPQLASFADDGLSIDNVRFSATAVVPEPSTFALMGIGSLLVLFRRRFQS